MHFLELHLFQDCKTKMAKFKGSTTQKPVVFEIRYDLSYMLHVKM